MNKLHKFTVNLVLDDRSRGWIIEKMALKLQLNLEEIGIKTTLSKFPSKNCDVNHFIIFHYVDPVPGTLNTMGITHVDDALKVDMIRSHLARGVRAGICMSRMTLEQLNDYGIERSYLTYALPGHDVLLEQRPIVVGITSANYADHRKRDWLLSRLASDLDLSCFEFRIFGSGWSKIVEDLRAGGAKVQVKEPSGDYVMDYLDIKEAIPKFDYYFYPGLDEGSLGTLDALSAGVPTIVTTQGFHLDIPYGITHGFWDYDEMLQIFRNISSGQISRILSVRQLTWKAYAERHMTIWSSLLDQGRVPTDQQLSGDPMKAERKYRIHSYFSLLRNRYRRNICLQFWIPKQYNIYRKIAARLYSVKKS